MKKIFTRVTSVFSLILVVLFSSNAQAQINFTNSGALLQTIPGTSSADCTADMNGDGYDDVVRVLSNGIYIDFQQTNGTFNPAFFPLAVQNTPDWSICVGDIDENGYMDILFGNGSAVSFVYASNDGTSYTEDAHPEYIFTQRSTFADIDNDGDLDAFANHDVDQCHPYRNTNGVMTLDYTLIQTLDVGGNYAAIWVDYDNDGDSDLYITKCRGGASWGDPQRINLLYKNNGDGTFTESGAEANMNDGNQSWTTVFEDFDNDGDFDAFTVNHSSGDVPGGAANKFMRNNGDGTFTNIIETTGINPDDLNAWNCDAGDFDNNGFVDIFSEMSTEMYWNNGDGTFTGSQLAGFNSGGIGDLNNDGFLDVISGNSLWLNDGNDNNYVKFDLEGIASNKSAIGARVEIYGSWGVQIREVRSSESFDPGSSLMVHFGLGSASSIDQVVVKWPSGTITSIDNPAINQQHTILEAGCVGAPITIQTSGVTTICPGSTVTLTAPAASSYNWNNGATSQSIEVANSGNYSVVAWSEANCASLSDMVLVEVITEENPTLTVSGDVVFCEGGSTVLTSTVAQQYTWSNGQSGQSIVAQESGDYFVSVEGLCSGVQYQSEPVSVVVMNAPTPIATDVTIGTPGQATLNATGSNLEWFDSATATVPVGSGTSFTTDFFDSNISYWVQSTSIYGGQEMTGGKVDNSGGGGTPATGGRLYFDITEHVTLQEVTVYLPDGSTPGNRTVVLYNGAGTLLASSVIFINAGANTLTLNYDLPEGTGYQIGCAENDLFRNNAGVTFPYSIGDVGSIYNSTNGTSYYYYFYNWKIKKQEMSCVSDRIQVNAAVVGINELTNPFGLSVYPNPVKNQLIISSQKNLTQAQLKLMDSVGRTIIQQQINIAGNAGTSVDVSGIAPGVYHVSLIQNGQQSVIEFIKE
jgi:hypothetical protein